MLWNCGRRTRQSQTEHANSTRRVPKLRFTIPELINISNISSVRKQCEGLSRFTCVYEASEIHGRNHAGKLLYSKPSWVRSFFFWPNRPISIFDLLLFWSDFTPFLWFFSLTFICSGLVITVLSLLHCMFYSFVVWLCVSIFCVPTVSHPWLTPPTPQCFCLPFFLSY